ncbi:MAG: OmcA/MtrC family decaheme c-type cytochrome [Deltaproteobacteria bacterium]|nr:OmcA/MtrC family decaheme c-type cytochrome [Deltaproteobacteria bacterium]
MFRRAAIGAFMSALGLAACSGDSGPAGPAGAPGTNGANGSNGTNGTNGTNCTVVDTSSTTKTITCEDGTSVVVQNGTPGTPGNPGDDGENGSSCSVTNNGDGTHTIRCTDGTTVVVADGKPGRPGGNVEVGNFHGAARLDQAAFEATGKLRVNVEITGATADPGGQVTVDFRVTNGAAPVSGIATINANIAKLLPAGNGYFFSRWVPYIYRTQTVSGSANGNWPHPDGTSAVQPNRENNGMLTDNGDGTYRYVFANNISAVTAGGNPITYERNRTHRISVMIGGSAGPTGTGNLDFVPDGTPVVDRRDIVTTAACQACHGDDFAAHGGDRLNVENCSTCHVDGAIDPHGGESLDLKVMIHKIHAGSELERIPGPDGVVWDNPSTPANEAADNGEYAIWGFGNQKHDWWKAEFPAVTENCEKCHQGAGGQVEAWKVPSRDACGACHESINFATGEGHPAGAQTSDENCDVCHPSSGTVLPPARYPVPSSHDWTVRDPRNIPEFDVNLTVSAPANGTHFVAGESPVVSIVLSENGTPIDHTTVIEDAAAEGCVVSGCPPQDGAFRTAAFFVHGPRAERKPVLTTTARAVVIAPTAGPYDISASGASLGIIVDGGRSLIRYDATGGDYTMLGTFSVAVSAGTFADRAAATPAEIVTWLNANTNFRRRAIAYLDAATGRLALRSRNLGEFFSIQLQAGPVTTAVFGGGVAIHNIAANTASNNISRRTNPANNDPKVAWDTGAITYTLDPVDDLVPGTYVASIEITDRGRIDAVNYQTPSVATVTFQVGTATEELPPARNCNSCHQGPDGRGFVLDFSRHNKLFGDNAVDQCGACHDNLSQNSVGNFTGAKSIVRRVHAVHFGNTLNYPLTTVGYSGGDPVPGRNWDIAFPMDVRNCQSCHPDGTTSGTWETKAARLPCGGCHDSDAATAHMSINTYDLTPADPFSGDEQESCRTCH